ncbi:MAG: hypothetical protein DKM50_01010 [Candidatus Margulisiibacteriota bacterium]|nr:MAG: hypothetical protein A2X43_12035 [Candidatus Margulisbacteria bacterium GWD2_39_127]OGI03185.1 MAG: hypothetical protein A2X42_11275 [Candidatus Margulisbacteria bacterium GWF2_38_17]OGI11209.1 MAG: hypothetical protein A2X41_03700 [Candidatus Margulisbacteria bacterium GWE2_39_32]PZM83889.1 MAG: hypothetical protein DKM50_01010 [Candidatus Margulisiibacteriota bacterium]HAR63857.1 hypothetical protein [Candidatus Margulisiibacteriota bacterium]
MKRSISLLIIATGLLTTTGFADTKDNLPTMQEILKTHRYEDKIDRDINSTAFYSMALIYTPLVFAKDDINRSSGIVGVALSAGLGWFYQNMDKGLFEKSYDSYLKKIKPEMEEKEKDEIAYSELKLISDQHKTMRLTGSLVFAGLGGLMAATDFNNSGDIADGQDNAEYIRLSGYGFMLWGLYEAIWGTTLFEEIVTKYEANKSKENIKISVNPGSDSIALRGSYSF